MARLQRRYPLRSQARKGSRCAIRVDNPVTSLVTVLLVLRLASPRSHVPPVVVRPFQEDADSAVGIGDPIVEVSTHLVPVVMAAVTAAMARSIGTKIAHGAHPLMARVAAIAASSVVAASAADRKTTTIGAPTMAAIRDARKTHQTGGMSAGAVSVAEMESAVAASVGVTMTANKSVSAQQVWPTRRAQPQRPTLAIEPNVRTRFVQPRRLRSRPSVSEHQRTCSHRPRWPLC